MRVGLGGGRAQPDGWVVEQGGQPLVLLRLWLWLWLWRWLWPVLVLVLVLVHATSVGADPKGGMEQ